MTQIALLGVGKMGQALLDRWAEAGRQVVLWNRSPLPLQRETSSAHLRWVDTPADAAAQADVVFTALTDGQALTSVLLDQGGLAAMSPGQVLVDLSTVEVAASAAVGAEAARRGVGYVRGAVSGTPAVVRAGASALLLSGDPTAYDKARPYLNDVTERQAFLGHGEEAKVVKIAVNSMLAGTMQLLAEAVTLAEASGVPREAFLDALSGTVIASTFTGYKSSALVKRDYGATFTTQDMRKDVQLAYDQAQQCGVSTPVAGLVLDALDEAIESGYGADDFLSLQRVAQTRSGLPVDSGASS